MDSTDEIITNFDDLHLDVSENNRATVEALEPIVIAYITDAIPAKVVAQYMLDSAFLFTKTYASFNKSTSFAGPAEYVTDRDIDSLITLAHKLATIKC